MNIALLLCLMHGVKGEAGIIVVPSEFLSFSRQDDDVDIFYSFSIA